MESTAVTGMASWSSKLGCVNDRCRFSGIRENREHRENPFKTRIKPHLPNPQAIHSSFYPLTSSPSLPEALRSPREGLQ